MNLWINGHSSLVALFGLHSCCFLPPEADCVVQLTFKSLPSGSVFTFTTGHLLELFEHWAEYELARKRFWRWYSLSRFSPHEAYVVFVGGSPFNRILWFFDLRKLLFSSRVHTVSFWQGPDCCFWRGMKVGKRRVYCLWNAVLCLLSSSCRCYWWLYIYIVFFLLISMRVNLIFALCILFLGVGEYCPITVMF